MSKIKKPLRIKVISIGNVEVGKSCIIKRYCEKRFVSKYLQTIGIDYGVTKLTLSADRDREIRVNIFDMSGHTVFHEVRNEFYKDTQGVMLVFDVTNRASFDMLEEWLNEMKQYLDQSTSTTENENNPNKSSACLDNIVFAVCGNKIDKGNKRCVEESEARYWAQSKGFLYFETSASSGAGISEMFETLMNEIVHVFDNGGNKSGSFTSMNMQQQQTQLGLNKDQLEAIQRLKNSKDNYERLGVKFGATKEEINNSFRRMARLIHPDKNVYPGSSEAFKILLNAKTDLLKKFP